MSRDGRVTVVARDKLALLIAERELLRRRVRQLEQQLVQARGRCGFCGQALCVCGMEEYGNQDSALTLDGGSAASPDERRV